MDLCQVKRVQDLSNDDRNEKRTDKKSIVKIRYCRKYEFTFDALKRFKY